MNKNIWMDVASDVVGCVDVTARPWNQPESVTQTNIYGGSESVFNDFHEVTICIPQKQKGLVIGKGGATINDIRRKHCVEISIEKELSQDNTSLCTVKGSDRSGVENAVNDIKRILFSDGNSNESSQRNVGDFEMEIEVHKSCKGSIIGKGGATIRRLQQSHGVTINIQTEISHSGHSKCLVKGSQVKAAVDEINGLIQRCNESDGGGGGFTSTTIDSGWNTESWGNTETSMASEGASCFTNKNNNHFQSNFQRSETVFPAASSSSVEYKVTDEFEVLPEHKGLVIGKGGSNIRDVQHRFSVQINMGEENICSVKGETRADVDAAIRQMKSIISAKDNECDARNLDMKQYTREEEDMYKDCDRNEYAIVKNLYRERPEVAALSADEVKEFMRLNNNISVQLIDLEDQKDVYLKKDKLVPSDYANIKQPKPVATFEQAFHDYPDVLAEVKKCGYERPTPIQCMLFPYILSGLDVIGVAQTGSGKTLAFLLPMFLHIIHQKKPRNQRLGPTGLILAPTRELAIQIQQEIEKINFRGITSICIYGGQEKRIQIDKLINKRPEIVVATPGRLADILQSHKMRTEDVSYVVFDEADRMLEMGFESEVLICLYSVRLDRTTVMTTATWPLALRRIAYKFVGSPFQINIGSLNLSACHDVDQRIEFARHFHDKKRRLEAIFTGAYIDRHNNRPLFDPRSQDKAIIFLSKKAECSEITDFVASLGDGVFRVTSIHGGKLQEDREESLKEFRESYARVLVATDLAARGIDIVDVTHVINFDFPRQIEEYVHRIGRTARAGRKGIAFTFMLRYDQKFALPLIDILQEAQQEVPRFLQEWAAEGPPVNDSYGGRRGGGGGGGFRNREQRNNNGNNRNREPAMLTPFDSYDN